MLRRSVIPLLVGTFILRLKWVRLAIVGVAASS